MPTNGDDVETGGAGPDVLDGLGGSDLIWGGGGADTLEGGDGNDVLYGSGPITGITATRVAVGLSAPLFAVSPPGDPNRLFVVEQHTGRVLILDLKSGQMLP